MSNVVSEKIQKFTKWLIAHKEAKMTHFISLLDKEAGDYNQVLNNIAFDHKEFLLKIHLRHQVAQGLIIGVSVTSAILSGLGVLAKFF